MDTAIIFRASPVKMLSEYAQMEHTLNLLQITSPKLSNFTNMDLFFAIREIKQKLPVGQKKYGIIAM